MKTFSVEIITGGGNSSWHMEVQATDAQDAERVMREEMAGRVEQWDGIGEIREVQQ